VACLCLAAPLAADAQTGKVWRIGYLSASVADGGTGFKAFQARLRELGYVEGQNVVLEVRSARNRPDALPGLATELVHLKVDVIVTGGRGTIEAAQKATTSIPIVMVIAADPVGSGLVASLARPGGNTTGLTVQYAEVSAKRLQLLKEVVPNLTRVAVLTEPGPSLSSRDANATASALGLQLRTVDVRSPGDLEAAFAAATKTRASAAVVGGPIAYSHRVQIAQLAIKRHLPTVGPSPEYAEAGCLMSYGPSYIDHGRRAADFVDRILKGTKPAELPVEQPTKFYLSVNLKTAKALGLNIPPLVLQRADQVFE
jgi:putative tryptophan/tyrosine transport system substrate-binding protein